MRHQNIGRRFKRSSSHRKAMLHNLCISILRHEVIKTTLPKAKDLRRVVERLITLAKEDTVHKRRLAFARLRDDATVSRLFDVVAPKFKQRPGGYTRILKCGYRRGDSAPMAIIELVERTQPALVEENEAVAEAS